MRFQRELFLRFANSFVSIYTVDKSISTTHKIRNFEQMTEFLKAKLGDRIDVFLLKDMYFVAFFDKILLSWQFLYYTDTANERYQEKM